MAEPFSLAVNVIQIIFACATTIKAINEVAQGYGEAGVKLRSLAAKASLVKATLNELNKILRSRSSFFARKIDADSDLKSAIDQTLTGCWTVFLLLQKKLQRLGSEDGKEPGFLRKAGLLFQDDIIESYRIQLDGHVDGLKTVLVCLQAQTVAETHETLARAEATLERIAESTANIREQNKEITFPESIYEGFTTYDEDKPFDKELLNSTAYRAAFRARTNSLVNGDASMITTASTARKDFLSDQHDEETLVHKNSNDLLNSDAVGDLISFGDNPDFHKNSPMSPNAQLMAGLTWESKVAAPHLLDDENAEMRMTKHVAYDEIDDLLDEMSQHTIKPVLPRTESISDREPRRDSGYPSSRSSTASNRTRGSVPTIIRHKSPATIQEERLPAIPQHHDGLIPCDTEDDFRGRSMSTSTSGTRRLSSPTLGYFSVTPVSPSSEGVPGIQALPNDQRLSNPDSHIPLADEAEQARLLDSMHHLTRSLDPEEQMDWAEDVLRHLSVTIAHEYRLANLNVKQKVQPKPLSDVEQTLRLEASRIVENLVKCGYGRAYFLSAKYIVDEGEREHLHLLAVGQRFHRSQFYLGAMAERRELMGDAIKRYQTGVSYDDAACLNKLARAYFEGGLGLKKNKEEGLRLLQEAAKHADKDSPEALYNLAMNYLDPPSTKGKGGLTSKPMLPKDVGEALTLLRKAAKLGHGPSQLRLGQVHRIGYFDPKEAKKAEKVAAKLTRTTSNKWGRRANSNASSIPTNSGDAEVDSTMAMHYLHLAARRGLPEADYLIAYELLWNHGELDWQHQRLAYAHTARALLGHVPLANGLMGKVLEEGIGCDIDLKQAEEFYFKGRQAGDDWSRERSDYLLNQGIGIAGGTEDTYKKPNTADPKGSIKPQPRGPGTYRAFLPV